MEYKNFHKKEYVNPEKLFKALNFLKENKHPSYLFFDDYKDYESRCFEMDHIGHNLIFVYEDGVDKIVDIDEHLEKIVLQSQIMYHKMKN